MMPTLPSLPASSLLYMIHSGFILESMKVHCSTLPGQSAISCVPSTCSPNAAGDGRGRSPDFGQLGAGVERGLQVREGLQVGLLAHAQVHQLLGLRLGGLLGAHLDEVIQGLQLAQCFPLVAGREQGRPWTGGQL